MPEQKPVATIVIHDEINVTLLDLKSKHYTKLYNEFAIKDKNCFFKPNYKLGRWDGYYRFVSQTGATNVYFIDKIVPMLVKWGYEIKVKDKRTAEFVDIEPVKEDIFGHVTNEHGDPYLLRWYQCEAINAVVQNGGGIMIAGTGAGKDQPLSSKILTPSGWTTMGDIVVGDDVVTPSGDIAPVVGVYPQGDKDVYELTFSDGSKARSGIGHLWTVSKPADDGSLYHVIDTIETGDIKDFLSKKAENPTGTYGDISIPTTMPVESARQTFELPPEEYVKLVETSSLPQDYYNGSVEQRWTLLRGIVGPIDEPWISFTTKSLELAKHLQDITWSLGGLFKIEPSDGVYDCTMEIEDPLQRPETRMQLMREVVSVELVSHEPTQCIMVDHPEHLYITDDYTVTHNTIISAAITKIYGDKGLRCITIVPSTTLVQQSSDDFKRWGLDAGQYCGDTKELGKTHLVTTWQSLQNVPHILQDFDVLIVDECHGAKANILASLLKDHGSHIAYRFGMTGTMPKDEYESTKVLLSLGDIHYQITAAMLIEQGFLSTIEINILQLMEDIDPGYFPDYAAEMSYLRGNKERIQWIADLAHKISSGENGNTLILVGSIPFGQKLARAIGAHFVYGADKTATRKEAYDLFKSEDNVVVVTTVQVAGTGLSIDRIFNLFLIDLGKSFIRTIQAVGRGLRKNEKAGKTHCEIYDICSNLKYSKQHLRKRVKFYKESEYPYKKSLIKNYADSVDSTE